MSAHFTFLNRDKAAELLTFGMFAEAADMLLPGASGMIALSKNIEDLERRIEFALLHDNLTYDEEYVISKFMTCPTVYKPESWIDKFIVVVSYCDLDKADRDHVPLKVNDDVQPRGMFAYSNAGDANRLALMYSSSAMMCCSDDILLDNVEFIAPENWQDVLTSTKAFQIVTGVLLPDQRAELDETFATLSLHAFFNSPETYRLIVASPYYRGAKECYLHSLSNRVSKIKANRK